MKLTTFSDYALRLLMMLAARPDRQVTIAEVASAYCISENHLMKVTHRLAQLGLVQSTRGKGGGIRLAMRAEDIRLGDVVRACEGEAAIVECMEPGGGDCRIAPSCRLAGLLADAFDALFQSLNRHTVADLVRRPARLNVLLRPRATARRVGAHPGPG